MRTAPLGSLVLVLSFLLSACFGPDDDGNKNDTSDTDTAPTSHPLVPDEYQNMWDWDASGCDDGDAAVYHLAEGHSVEETIDGEQEMVLYATERWFWFHGKEDFDGDCVDKFDFRGVETRYTWGSIDPCGECEEEYWGSYNEDTDVEDGCNYIYGGLFFGEDGMGEGNDFSPMVLKMETLGPSGNPNEDNKLLVYQAMSLDGYWYFDSSYGGGQIFPDEEGDYGGPSQYHWVNLNTMCI
jgi:hypothetical protein